MLIKLQKIKILRVILIFIVLPILFIFFIQWYDSYSTPKEVVFIEADNAPTKVKPITPKGKYFPDIDKNIYERLSKHHRKTVTNIIPVPESPMLSWREPEKKAKVSDTEDLWNELKNLEDEFDNSVLQVRVPAIPNKGLKELCSSKLQKKKYVVIVTLSRELAASLLGNFSDSFNDILDKYDYQIEDNNQGCYLHITTYDSVEARSLCKFFARKKLECVIKRGVGS